MQEQDFTEHEGIHDLVRLWALRMLVIARGHQQLISHGTVMNDALAANIGLKQEDSFESNVSSSKLLRKLKSLHRRAEAAASKAQPQVPEPLAANVFALGRLTGLMPAESRLLEFALLTKTDSTLAAAAGCLVKLSVNRLHQVLSMVLDLPLVDIKEALSGSGRLERCGLLSIRPHLGCDLDDRLEVLSETFADRAVSVLSDPLDLIKDKVNACSLPTLSLDDFCDARPVLDVLRPYLRMSASERRTGVNVLIYGSPGTGKSQLARVLARDCDQQLFEVATENDSGNSVGGDGRMTAYRAAQAFLPAGRSLIVFDEAEDIFSTHSLFASEASFAQRRKGWMNRALETNPVPTIWLTNDVSCMDPAFVRRFDLVFQLRIPGPSRRLEMARNMCGQMVSERMLKRLADSDALAPAVLSRASAVLERIGRIVPREKWDSTISELVNGTLVAQGHSRVARADRSAMEDIYDPSLVNADHDLLSLADNLRQSPSARICLYGPPGTGKTAYARWLAAQVQRPLITKSASSLLSPYVGETEKNLANAFQQADQDGAVLFLDEVDSYLQDRRNDRRSWEITQVNELLTQMDDFRGILFAATNLMSGLDQASMRRFDAKIKFGFLVPDQAWLLLTKCCELMRLDAPDRSLIDELRRLDTLTPGDFSALQRKHELNRFRTPRQLVSGLAAECHFKDTGSQRAIGFLH